MPHALTVTFEVQADDRGRGVPPTWAARQIRHALDNRKGFATRVTIGEPVRTRPQDGLWFTYMGRISMGYYEAGQPMSKDDCHDHFKEKYLPIVAAMIERDTGEVIDIGPIRRKPNGETKQEYSIQGITKQAMSLLIDLVAADDDVLAMGVPFPTDEVPA